MAEIVPERLTEIRKMRGMGRPKLAKLAGLTERQVARLEGALPLQGAIPEDAALRLAAALQVRAELFSGETPLTDADFAPRRSCSCCS